MKPFAPQLAVLVLAFVGIASKSAHPQSQADDNPIEARAREFARAVSTGNPEKLEEMVMSSFGPDMRKIPKAAQMGILMSYWDMTHGLDFYRLQSSQPNEGTALFINRLTGGLNSVFFRLESEPPHRVVAIRPGFEEPSEEAPKKLSHRQIMHELDSFLRTLSRADVFSGAVLLAKDGVVVFKGAYGEADKDHDVPNRIDTRFNLGSMNKMFTAVAIAQLVERGRLAYDDPLSKFLPDFPDAGSAQKIQIKHLLSHTAGLGMWWGPRYQQSAKDSFRTVDDMIKWAAQDEKTTQFEPGTKYQYSNTGFVVLGKIIEEVSETNYYDYIRDNIYRPAGMSNTDSYELDRNTPDRAIGYQKSFDSQGKVFFRNNLYTNPVRGGPHGGGYSTIEDLLKFDRALRSGKLLKPQSLQILLTVKPDLGATRYGYGFDVDEKHRIAGHSGGGMGNSDNLDMFLDSGWTGIVLANYTESALEVSRPVVLKIRELVRDGTSSE